MRSDPEKDTNFRTSSHWNKLSANIVPFMPDPKTGKLTGVSFSGGERNRLFMQGKGNFDDVSLVSDVDFRQDGRCFATFDFDSDGFIDMGVVSTTRPRLRILRNLQGESIPKAKANWVKVKLVGGATGTNGNEEFSSRQPFNATLLVRIGDQQRCFNYSCFDGLNNQNSEWLHIGLADNENVDEISVRWPSGRTSVVQDWAAGKSGVIYEREETASTSPAEELE